MTGDKHMNHHVIHTAHMKCHRDIFHVEFSKLWDQFQTTFKPLSLSYWFSFWHSLTVTSFCLFLSQFDGPFRRILLLLPKIAIWYVFPKMLPNTRVKSKKPYKQEATEVFKAAEMNKIIEMNICLTIKHLTKIIYSHEDWIYQFSLLTHSFPAYSQLQNKRPWSVDGWS